MAKTFPRKKGPQTPGTDSSDNEEEHAMDALLVQMNSGVTGSMLSLQSGEDEAEVIDLTIHQAAREGRGYSRLSYKERH